MKQKAMKELLWIVPRFPWPPRCGASVANCELLLAMAELGYRIHLVCFGHVSTEADRFQAKRELNLESVEVILWPLLLRARFSRLVLSLIRSLHPRSPPLSVIPFTLARSSNRIKKILTQHPYTPIVWDGLHPMGTLSKDTRDSHFGVQIYRAHNIESHIWNGFASSLPHPLSCLFGFQSERMAFFERDCMARANGIAFVQKADEDWFKVTIDPEKTTRVVPISTTPKSDPLALQVSRWNGLNLRRESSIGLSLLWVGGMDWWPNRQAIEWFLESVWRPLFEKRSDIQLSIVGRGTEKLKSFRTRNVTAHGFKKDIEGDFSNADALIVPIQSGSGMRVKGIESLARAVPCIGTPLGVCGLPQEGLFVCRSAEDWINTLSQLTPEECFIRGMLGYRALKNQFGRTASGQLLEELLIACRGAPTEEPKFGRNR